jgi:hypothetical protein
MDERNFQEHSGVNFWPAVFTVIYNEAAYALSI